MMRFRTGWILLAGVALLATPALAATRYVSPAPTGSDGGVPPNDCTTPTAPCRTIQHAVDMAEAGDAIRVFPGTYVECVDASAKALDFVADDIEIKDPPDRTTTIIDGTGLCGGRVCLLDLTKTCFVDDTCAGTCDIVEGETTGHCTNAPSVTCTSDENCDNPCVPAGRCTDEVATLCATNSQCAGGSTCAPIVSAGAAISLADGSTLKGFTVKGGGDSGVRLAGAATIEQNLISGNESAGYGGGIFGFVQSVGSATKVVSDGAACWGDLDLACAGDADCSVCDKDHAIVCTSTADCDPTEAGECLALGPCLSLKLVTIDDNVIQDNRSNNGGGVYLELLAAFSAGAKAVITANTVSGNASVGACGESYCSYGIGGGIYTLSYSYDGGLTDAKVDGNALSGNTADTFGGGVAANLFSFSGGENRVAITTNTVDGNSAGQDGGGVVGALGSYYVTASSDQLRVSGNTVTANSADFDGGGVAVQLVRSYGWSVQSKGAVEENIVTGNSAGDSGGGIDLFVGSYNGFETETMTPNALVASKNTVKENTAARLGGGVNTFLLSYGAFALGALRVEQNTIESNTAAVAGGGASLETDSYFVLGKEAGLGTRASTRFSTEHWFDNNLVSGNKATNDDASGVGGGVFSFLYTRSGGLATQGVDFATLQGNQADLGGGGVEVEADTGDVSGGSAFLVVSNSIALDNVGYGLGGPVPGFSGTLAGPSAGDLSIGAFFNDGFGNTDGNYERTLVDNLTTKLDGVETNIVSSPKLDASGVPSICSPTVDAGDPTSPFDQEPQPDGLRANMGHLGNTALATITLPDVNFDRQVSSIDIVLLSNAFGATAPTARIALPPGRYLPELDLNHDQIIDGDDLAYVAAHYGTDCR